MKSVPFTVIIPTRERADVLEKSLATATIQNYDNLRIIVSDNFSGDHTQAIVRQNGDPRITYINTGKRLSMSHNWEFALSHVRDGWVTIIGDDDGLLPDALTKVEAIIRETGTAAVRSNVCHYLWPESLDRAFGHLTVPRESGFEIRDSRLWLTKTLNGQADYPSLPMLYNGGFVSLSTIDAIRSKAGAFYRSSVPDVYSAIAIARSIPNFVYSNEPLAINGASRHSTGTSHFSANNYSKGSPTDRYLSEDNIPYHDDLLVGLSMSLPKSLHLLVYESYLQSSYLSQPLSGVTSERQLEIILAQGGPFPLEIREWAALFASKYGLDFQRILRNAKRRATAIRAGAPVKRLANAVRGYKVGSAERPIRDVYEATSAAADLLRLRPSRLRDIPRLFNRTLEITFGT